MPQHLLEAPLPFGIAEVPLLLTQTAKLLSGLPDLVMKQLQHLTLRNLIDVTPKIFGVFSSKRLVQHRHSLLSPMLFLIALILLLAA
ncbi:hypothetical protein D3C81_1569200 [compost metagenome]